MEERLRLWGGKQQALFVASMWLLFVGSVVSLLGLLFCVYLCLLALWSALSFARWVSGLERGSFG